MSKDDPNGFGSLVNSLYRNFSEAAQTWEETAAAESSSPEGRRSVGGDALRTVAENLGGGCFEENAVSAVEILAGMIAGAWSMVAVWETPERQWLIARKNEGDSGGRPLSEREHQVTALAVRGHANKYIAIELGMTESTAATHLRRAMSKLGVQTRTELIRAFPKELFE